ncbi:MAG: helix-turn-helix domain-containing protein [Calditrichia bacterium]
MKNQNEYELRHKAIQLHNDGIGFNEILQRLLRSRGWLAKWIKRYKEHGLEGLKDKSHTPKKIHTKTPDRMVENILRISEELESHKTRCSAFSGIGAEVIHWELQRRRFKNFPSISILQRNTL